MTTPSVAPPAADDVLSKSRVVWNAAQNGW